MIPRTTPHPSLPNGSTQSCGFPRKFLKKLVNSLYKPTTALPVSYKSSFITYRPWISEDFLKKRTLPDSPDTTAVSKEPRLAGDDSISIPMNSQEGKDVGNDRSECNNANPTPPQQSTSKVSSTRVSEERLLKFLAAKMPLRQKN